MSDLSITRTSQNVLTATFTWNHDDTMDNTAGVSKDFGLTATGAGCTVVDVIRLPPNSIVVGGHLDIIEAFDTAGYDIIVGDSTDTDRYMATADVKGVGTTALLAPGFVNTTGLDVRLTIGNDDVCTTGQARLVVQYVIDGRAQEVN